MRLRYFDAHNHLQDDRLRPHLAEVIASVKEIGVEKMVVNGSCEYDWPLVLDLAREHSFVVPSFGYHPWYVKERTPEWKESLSRYLDEAPSAIGEIGLDRWIENYDLPAQEDAFVFQLRLAAERNLPVSIHCLKAWGRLLELLESNPRPECGFLLHSYGGPREMIDSFANLGGFFSLPGYFAHERKTRQRETFKHIPRQCLLIETDAPDQLLPEQRSRFNLRDGQNNKPLNHPANIQSVYAFAAELLQQTPEALAEQVERNFKRLFGNVL